MKHVISAMVAVFLLLGATGAIAKDCVYEGRSYPPGTRIGPLTCQDDGTWR